MKSIDDVKNYWNNRPCNFRHSQKPVGTQEYFNEVGVKKYFVEPHIRAFADFSYWEGKKVLEIGCGLGTETLNFACAGAFVTVVELSEKSMDMAKQRAKLWGLESRIKFHLGNAENLTAILKPQIFDLIWSFGVIHHSPYPEKIIMGIKEFMGRHTKLKIMVYHKYSWKVFWILFRFGKRADWDIDKLIAKYSEAQIGSPVTYAYSKFSVRKLLRGLTIESMQVDHIFPWKFPEYKNNKYIKVWYFRWIPKTAFRWVEKKLGWHLCVTAHL